MERSQIFGISLLTSQIQLLLVVMKAVSLNICSNNLFSLQITLTSSHKTFCYASHTCSANTGRAVFTFSQSFCVRFSSFTLTWRGRQVSPSHDHSHTRYYKAHSLYNPVCDPILTKR